MEGEREREERDTERPEIKDVKKNEFEIQRKKLRGRERGIGRQAGRQAGGRAGG